MAAPKQSRSVAAPRPDPGERPTGQRWNIATEADADDWRARAACRYVDPELFFPVGSTGAALEQIRAAKAFCLSCPVKPACLEFALATNQEDGVWGGEDETERRRLRRDWRQARRLPRRQVGA